jgi:hypothetical protein
MKLFQSSKAPIEPYQPSADWHRSSLHFFCRSYEFTNHKKQNQFLVEVIQLHDNKVVIEATAKPGDVIEVILRSREDMEPCDSESCCELIQRLESCYSKLNDDNIRSNN